MIDSEGNSHPHTKTDSRHADVDVESTTTEISTVNAKEEGTMTGPGVHVTSTVTLYPARDTAYSKMPRNKSCPRTKLERTRKTPVELVTYHHDDADVYLSCCHDKHHLSVVSGDGLCFYTGARDYLCGISDNPAYASVGVPRFLEIAHYIPPTDAFELTLFKLFARGECYTAREIASKYDRNKGRVNSILYAGLRKGAWHYHMPLRPVGSRRGTPPLWSHHYALVSMSSRHARMLVKLRMRHDVEGHRRSIEFAMSSKSSLKPSMRKGQGAIVEDEGQEKDEHVVPREPRPSKSMSRARPRKGRSGQGSRTRAVQRATIMTRALDDADQMVAGTRDAAQDIDAAANQAGEALARAITDADVADQVFAKVFDIVTQAPFQTRQLMEPVTTTQWESQRARVTAHQEFIGANYFTQDGQGHVPFIDYPRIRNMALPWLWMTQGGQVGKLASNVVQFILKVLFLLFIVAFLIVGSAPREGTIYPVFTFLRVCAWCVHSTLLFTFIGLSVSYLLFWLAKMIVSSLHAYKVTPRHYVLPDGVDIMIREYLIDRAIFVLYEELMKDNPKAWRQFILGLEKQDRWAFTRGMENVSFCAAHSAILGKSRAWTTTDLGVVRDIYHRHLRILMGSTATPSPEVADHLCYIALLPRATAYEQLKDITVEALAELRRKNVD